MPAHSLLRARQEQGDERGRQEQPPRVKQRRPVVAHLGKQPEEHRAQGGGDAPDIVPLALYARDNGFEVRYIEFMPLDAQNLWDRGKVLLADEIIDTLSREIAPLTPVPDPDPRAPASEYDFADGIGRVGFIASVSRPFCLNCNRIRLTADGKLRYCLFAIQEDDVKSLMRSGASDEEIAALIRRNLAGKWEGHEINSAKFVAPPRPMYSIGG
jgi:cyclic pyranopterin phosphate synthase